MGAVEVTHFDISPDGSRLVVAGSFTTVNGLDRAQIAILSLQGGSVSVADWETDRFKTACKLKAGGIIRDVAFSPDSSYFVVGATGGASACAIRSAGGTHGGGIAPARDLGRPDRRR